MKKFVQLLYAFIFLMLLSIKVSAVHVYSHCDSEEDPVEHCASCDWAMESQQSLTTLEHSTFIFEGPNQVVTNSNPVCYSGLELPKTPLECNLFSRPPPSAVI